MVVIKKINNLPKIPIEENKSANNKPKITKQSFPCNDSQSNSRGIFCSTSPFTILPTISTPGNNWATGVWCKSDKSVMDEPTKAILPANSSGLNWLFNMSVAE